MPAKSIRKKTKKTAVPSEGIACIYASFSNTIITITDMQGNTLISASGGSVGFKGSRKGTPYAGQMAAKQAGAVAKERGMQRIAVQIRGPGPGRESAMRALHSCDLIITQITDRTSIPHNGCRPRKKRRM